MQRKLVLEPLGIDQVSGYISTLVDKHSGRYAGQRGGLEDEFRSNKRAP